MITFKFAVSKERTTLLRREIMANSSVGGGLLQTLRRLLRFPSGIRSGWHAFGLQQRDDRVDLFDVSRSTVEYNTDGLRSLFLGH